METYSQNSVTGSMAGLLTLLETFCMRRSKEVELSPGAGTWYSEEAFEPREIADALAALMDRWCVVQFSEFHSFSQ